jgi:hypothetical protein
MCAVPSATPEVARLVVAESGAPQNAWERREPHGDVVVVAQLRAESRNDFVARTAGRMERLRCARFAPDSVILAAGDDGGHEALVQRIALVRLLLRSFAPKTLVLMASAKLSPLSRYELMALADTVRQAAAGVEVQVEFSDGGAPPADQPAPRKALGSGVFPVAVAPAARGAKSA